MLRADNVLTTQRRRKKLCFVVIMSSVVACVMSTLKNIAHLPVSSSKLRIPSHSPGSTQNVFVASHRRSGTHLLMNFVHNHFDGTHLSIKKTNHLAADDSLGCTCLNGMFSSGKVIYVEREFPSVLQSMFYYMRQIPNNYKVAEKTSLRDFLKNDELVFDIAWMWFHTHRTWMQFVHSGDVLKVTFNGLLEDPMESMQNISTFLGIQTKVRTHKRVAGTLVGVGKGLQPPHQDVVDEAQWALSVIESNGVHSAIIAVLEWAGIRR